MDSKIRQWIEQRQQELKYSNTLSHEGLFVLMMYGLANFGKPSTDDKCGPALQHIGLDASEHYGGDASLFELGCYLYVCTDIWLFSNRPHLRNEISSVYVREFIRLLSAVLGTANVYELFYQRVEKYGALFRTGDEEVMNKFLFYLTELILRTRDNTPPASYVFDHEEVTPVFESIGVKVAVSVWISTMLPGIIESLEKYCDRVGQQS